MRTMAAAMAMALPLAALLAAAAAAAPAEIDYVALAKRSYHAGIAERATCGAPRGSGVTPARCCRGGCAPDTW